MKQFVIILLFAFGLSVNAEAQSFLDNLKKDAPDKGHVTVIQSADIDELVNKARLEKQQNVPAEKTAADKQTPVKGSHVAGDNSNIHNTASSSHADKPAADAPDSSVNGNERRNTGTLHRITGYRIQAYSGGNSREDRQKAERISGAIKSRFPDISVYVHFYSPRWICRVGNFRTYEEAAKMLKEIKGMGYTQACIVKGKISVRY